MFLYLSKLLPLFFYPLGLMSISLIVALVTLWKRPRIAGRIDWRGGGESESADMANVLTSIGIPSEVIVQEPDSLNTYQNAVNV
ncbi:YdcF family protein, partial [Nodularia spumigena CS-591/04]